MPHSLKSFKGSTCYQLIPQYIQQGSYNKTKLDRLIFQIYFWNKTLRVSDSSSFYHQEFFTVHTVMVYVIQVC